MKKLLTILLTLFLFNPVYADEQKTTYYPTGEVKQVQEYPDIGRMDFKLTHFYKTGEVKKVEEYISDRISKAILHHKTGEVKMVKEYVDGLKSKITHYHKTGKLKKAYKFVGNKTLTKTSDSDEWSLIAAEQFIKANNNNIKQILLGEIRRLGNNADLNHIDVSNVTDMRALFLHSPFNGDISKWDVSNVTNMDRMFTYSKFNGDISKWNVSNVKVKTTPEDTPVTFYYLFITLLYSTPLLALYIYYFRNSLNTTGSKLIWGITTLYTMTWIYPYAVPSSHPLLGWSFLLVMLLTPLLVGSWVVYGLSRLYKKRFKKR